MRCAVLALLAIVLVAPSAGAEVAVRVASDQVNVDAEAAPLSDVLDRLARQTGMEVIYEGNPPRQRITVALQDRTPSEAVLAILEGQGLNYAMVADPTGAKVRTLIIAGAAGTGTSTGGSPSSGRSRRPTRRPPPAASPEMSDPDYDEVEEGAPFDFEDPAAYFGEDPPSPEMSDPDYDEVEEEPPFDFEDPSAYFGEDPPFQPE